MLRFANPGAFLRLSPSLTDGLVAYYPFNGNANDESGNNRHGTVHDATLTTDRFGNANKAYAFDGVNDWIDVAKDAAFQFNDFTLSAWTTIVDKPSGTIACYPANGSTEDAWYYGYGELNGQLISAYVYPGIYLFGRRPFIPNT
ncbi:hypothetical protein BLX24_04195 [Arsenicibacter rosenii]|uniref:Uncharacterized protein n=1 Tax=Arsenicibacter rosenii TaxID=1750698 RepID=A0A1S2VQI2_9BACT|nr:hypothetical protein BLX24_04195 [Arsenicibacter rosenii]